LPPIWLALALAIGMFGGSSPHAATTERVVVDPNSGLALYGIDPVAYFTDAKPTPGREDFEYRFAGAVWRFANPGNRAAFAADPEVYMPRFGGYDPLGVARGIATPGYPELWSMVENRIYLFYTRQARDAFIGNPAAAIAAADARWPELMSRLVE
jgi:hypothetical protein